MPKALQNTRVIVISSLFHPCRGGAEKQLERLAQSLSSRGVGCCVLTRRLAGLTPLEYLQNVAVYRVFAVQRSKGLCSTLSFILSSFAFFVGHPTITKSSSILQADVDSPGLVATIVSKLLGKKTIIRVRGKVEIENLKRSFLARTIFRIISKLSDGIVVQYRLQGNDVKLLGVESSKIYVIPNGVNTELYKKTHALVEDFREKMGVKGSVIGLYVGRLEPAKGLDLLIRAVPRVIESFPQFTLIVVGSGSHQTYLVNLAKDLQADKHILFCDATDNVKKYYEIADIFVLPSRSEGISNALLEAMSMELPAVATAVGGTPEVIKDLKNGCLAFPSPSGIAEKLKLLIANKDLRHKIGKEARKTVVSSFQLERVTEEYVKLYTLKTRRAFWSRRESRHAVART